MSMGMEILADGTSKGAALKWLCNHLGISTDNAAAFGDSLNDVAMLSAAGMGTAVANARREDFEAAAYITLTNDQAGFSRFLTWALGE
ncbi:MAG: HAD hydrolase family protein [Atopobium sp.]|nr:HAD hydrolase family protein [Atopobium sp.]